MTRALVLDEDGIESLNCVVEYNWDKELKDYKQHVADGNSADCHVFVSLVHLHNLLHGTTLSPGDYDE